MVNFQDLSFRHAPLGELQPGDYLPLEGLVPPPSVGAVATRSVSWCHLVLATLAVATP
jgi:hypothetical protein